MHVTHLKKRLMLFVNSHEKYLTLCFFFLDARLQKTYTATRSAATKATPSLESSGGPVPIAVVSTKVKEGPAPSSVPHEVEPAENGLFLHILS